MSCKFSAADISAHFPSLLTKGFFVQDGVLPQFDEINREASVHGVSADISCMRHNLLEISDSALSFLNTDELSVLVENTIRSDALLSRCRVLTFEPNATPPWHHDFEGPLQDLSSRHFRPGITFCFPLQAQGATVRIACYSHLHVVRAEDNRPENMSHQQVHIPAGAVLVMNCGVYYQFSPSTMWMDLTFCLPWIKPEILLSSALSAQRFQRLGEMASHWCGANLGLPISVKEFIDIEEAALSSKIGKSKGSGI